MSGGVSGSTSDLNLVLAFNQRRATDALPEDNDLPPDAFAEWDSPETIEAVRAALARRHNVTPVEATPDAFEKIRSLRPDLVFNMAEGLDGNAREGIIPSMLDWLRIPYTGSNATTLNLCLHKARAKEVLRYHGIPVADHEIHRMAPEGPPAFGFPAVVKPLHEGSSKGIVDAGLVRTLDAYRKEVRRIVEGYREPAVVEPFLPGREFTVALIGNPPDVRALPVVEIRLDALPPEANRLYSYEAKWIWDVPDNPLEIFECPARLEPELAGRIERSCVEAFTVLECADWSRIDVRLDEEGVPCIIEVNPLPGVLPTPEENSCFPKAARAAGMSYEDLLAEVVDVACRRHGIASGKEAVRP